MGKQLAAVIGVGQAGQEGWDGWIACNHWRRQVIDRKQRGQHGRQQRGEKCIWTRANIDERGRMLTR